MKYRIRNIVTGELVTEKGIFLGKAGIVCSAMGRSCPMYRAEMHWCNGFYEGDLIRDAFESVNLRVELNASGWSAKCDEYEEGLYSESWLVDAKPVGYSYKDMDGKLVEVLK